MNAAETGTAAPNGVQPTAPQTNQPEMGPTTSTSLPTVYVAPPTAPDTTTSAPDVESSPVVIAPEPSILDVGGNHAIGDSSKVDSLTPQVGQETIPETMSTSEVESSSPPDAPDDEINDLD
jgi:hypothetical protein